MDKIKRIKKGHILFLLIAFGIIAFVIFAGGKKEAPEEPSYEPAPPEAPRLSSLGVFGYEVDFSPEVRYYEVLLPAGNPIVPNIWANTEESDTRMEMTKPYFEAGKNETSAKVTLYKGRYQNSYEVKFIKDFSKGLVLQYDDRYNFVPKYKLKEGESFTFATSEGGWNLNVDENGTIRAVGISDTPAAVNAYVGDTVVDSITIDKTIKAVLDIFVVAGQSNATGEGGNVDESVKPIVGTSYTVELDGSTFDMNDLSTGRQGFTPAIAEKWYSLTSEKSLFIQTAVSDVSVTKWTPEGEAYKMAETRIRYFTEKLALDESPYTVNKVFCLWLHGEWDIAGDMTSEEYIQHFTSFYEGMKGLCAPEMTAVIPVRSSLQGEDGAQIIEPVCAAQYMLSNVYEDIRLITFVPDGATVDNGMVSQGNLYYTQTGYNTLGADVALNLYNCYSPDTDKTVKQLEVYGGTRNGKIENGGTVKLRGGEELRTVTVIAPLYAAKDVVIAEYDSSLVEYTSGGVIRRAAGNLANTPAEIKLQCGSTEFLFTVEFADDGQSDDGETVVYEWTFDDLNEKDNQNALVLSGYSADDSYTVKDGVLTLNDRLADFRLGKPIVISSDCNWSIEWIGSLNDNSILLGGSFSTKGYIYLAPFAQNMGYSVRMVDDRGQTFYLPYGEYAEKNRQPGQWKLEYSKDNKTITLYCGDDKVADVKVDKAFNFTFTNLLGRYGSENVNYCYTGTLDNLKAVCG